MTRNIFFSRAGKRTSRCSYATVAKGYTCLSEHQVTIDIHVFRKKHRPLEYFSCWLNVTDFGFFHS